MAEPFLKEFIGEGIGINLFCRGHQPQSIPLGKHPEKKKIVQHSLNWLPRKKPPSAKSLRVPRSTPEYRQLVPF